MLVQTWGDAFTVALQELGMIAIHFVPVFIFAIVLLAVGWVVGSILGRVVGEVFDALRIDMALRGAGVEEFIERAGYKMNSGKFFGGLIKWLIIIAFMAASFELLNLQMVTTFLQEVALFYIPQLAVVVLVLLFGAIIAEFTKNFVIGSAKAIGATHSNLLGAVTKTAIWVFAILIALSHLNIAAGFADTLFQGIVVGLALAFGLAFGLGGQESAARYLDKVRKEISHN
jgi:ABC-type multidrug transport system fused ATPase/permease subunit